MTEWPICDLGVGLWTPTSAHRVAARVQRQNALGGGLPDQSHVKGYPFEVPVANTGTITGVILADHVKNLDWQARKVVFEAKAPADVLSEVQERLRALLREPNTSKKASPTGRPR